jgi:hypothetical protein
MKTRYLTTTLFATGLALATPYALADNDELAAAIVLGGTGAVLGHAIGGSDGAVIGGFLGAILGAASADDHGRYADYRRGRDYRHGYPPVYAYDPPRDHRWRDEWRDHDRRWNSDRWNDNGWRRDRDGDDSWGHRR